MDQAIVLRVKKNILSKATSSDVGDEVPRSIVGQPRVTQVESNLSKPGWEGKLIKAGFDPGQPSAWILEGFAM